MVNEGLDHVEMSSQADESVDASYANDGSSEQSWMKISFVLFITASCHLVTKTILSLLVPTYYDENINTLEIFHSQGLLESRLELH